MHAEPDAGMVNDNDLFQKYFEQYYTRVLKHVMLLTGSRQVSEDIVQETFVKLYQKPPSHSNVGGWLMKVSTNLAYNHIRREKKIKSAANVQMGPDNVVSIEDAAIRNTEVRQVRSILDKLGPRDRMCLILKFSGYKYGEIAEITGIRLTTVGKVISRAVAKFKNISEGGYNL